MRYRVPEMEHLGLGSLLHLIDNQKIAFRAKLKAIYNNLSISHRAKGLKRRDEAGSRRGFVPAFEHTTRRDKIINCFPYLRCAYRVFQEMP